jgi:dTDP-glucose 4,6-dehydratase
VRILITGGAGFIGSNFIRLIVDKHPDWQIVNFDNLTYAGNLANLADITDHKNYSFVRGDIANSDDVSLVFEQGFDYIVNFAAETHVDRSLYDPHIFIRTNVLGTQVLLEQALKSGVKRFLQISTDEVYGSIESPDFADETCTLNPSSPYAASKASADLLAMSYYKTHSLPVLITRTCNNYGPYQFPEKIIPFFITRALNEEKLPVYGDGSNIRDWLYVTDNCEAILETLENGNPGEIYNISGDTMISNLELTKSIISILGKTEKLITFVKDRPGHDLRYAIDSSKIRKQLGWSPKISIEDGLRMTIDWYLSNTEWRGIISSGDYRKFYETHYKDRK